MWSAKTRSPDVTTAIEELLSVIAGLNSSCKSVFKAFNTVSQRVPKGKLAPRAAHTESSTQTEKNKNTTNDSDSQTSVSTDDRSTAILGAIVEVKVIIARTDTRVTEQQKQIN